ncbi:MAG: chromosome segregation protein SMC, partial [Candidatus Electrothrix sp. AUS4]|nr:chromosome segregation protein SMC [Candidatus Electrothrix sp. AUS4]
MSDAVKQEFFRWVRSLNPKSLNSTQIKLLNIIILHFDIIKPLGTAAGKRAKKICQLIQENYINLSESIPDLVENKSIPQERADRIIELVIGPFRGFAKKEKFNLDNKYAFIYGPNGSGKSSFCEGLEYALLGDIEEASSKRLKLQDYICNTEKKRADPPEAYTIRNNEKTRIPQDQALYRFSFIEKNRIDRFARLAAASPG